MARKISISITPKYKLNLTIPDKNSFKEPAQKAINLLDFVGRNFSIAIALLFFLLPSLTNQSNLSILNILIYAIAIIFVVIQILRVLTVKGPHFLGIPLDIPILIFTTLIALSFFYNTAIVRTNTNIWGGPSLNAISGVSIISMSLIYYFFYINNQSKLSIRRMISAFKVSPLISFILIILFNLQISNSAIEFLAILFPAQLIWSFYVNFSGKSKPKVDILNGINLLISLFCLLYFYNPINILVSIITLFIIFLTLIISKRDSLAKMFKNIDKKQKNIYESISKNLNISILIITLILIAVGIYSIIKIPNVNDYYFIYNGFASLSELHGVSIFLGRGLTNTVPVPLLFQFINAYGLVPFLALGLIGFFFAKHSLQILKRIMNVQARILFKTLTILIINIFLFYILSSSSSIFPLIALSASASLILIIEKVFTMDGKEFSFSTQATKFIALSEEKEYFLRVMKRISIALIILFSIYLLCSLNYINIFINA